MGGSTLRRVHLAPFDPEIIRQRVSGILTEDTVAWERFRFQLPGFSSITVSCLLGRVTAGLSGVDAADEGTS